MAVTLTDFAPYKLTNNGTAGVATKVTFPPGAVAFDVVSETSAGRYSNTGTDAQAIGDDYMTLPAGAYVSIPLPRAVYGSPPVVYFAHTDNSGVIRLVPIFDVTAVV